MPVGASASRIHGPRRLVRTQVALVGLLGLSLACAAAPRSELLLPPTRLQLTFAAEADSFRAATREYDSLWTSDAVRMTRALEAAAHLRFADIGDTVIRAMVFEGVSA